MGWQNGSCALQLPKVHCGTDGGVDEKGDHPGVAKVTGELDNRSVMEACMGGKRRYQMLDKDTRYREGAKYIQVGAVSHEDSVEILPCNAANRQSSSKQNRPGVQTS
jgi:hypothetical protein